MAKKKTKDDIQKTIEKLQRQLREKRGELREMERLEQQREAERDAAFRSKVGDLVLACFDGGWKSVDISALSRWISSRSDEIAANSHASELDSDGAWGLFEAYDGSSAGSAPASAPVSDVSSYGSSV